MKIISLSDILIIKGNVKWKFFFDKAKTFLKN